MTGPPGLKFELEMERRPDASAPADEFRFALNQDPGQNETVGTLS